MNKIKLVSISILSVLLFFTSCSKDDKQSTPQNEEEEIFLSAKIDGIDFFTDFPLYISFTEQEIAVSGQNDENTLNIQITIVNYSGPGSYPIGSSNDNENIISLLDNGVWLTDKDNGTGTVTFIEEGDFLGGTFSFDAVNPQNSMIKNITDGEFYIQIHF